MGCCCSKQVDKIKEKVESKWVDELTDEAGYFHQYSEWQRIIQGGKNEEKPKEEEEGKEKKEKNRLQRAVMIKACGKVSSKIHASFLDVLHQGLGQGFSEAGAKTACSGRAGTGEIALVLNALSAVSLSYLYENTAIKRNAFAADNSVKFGKIRAFAIKRLATALSGLMALKVDKAAEAASDTVEYFEERAQDVEIHAQPAAAKASAVAGAVSTATMNAEATSDAVDAALERLQAGIAEARASAKQMLDGLLQAEPPAVPDEGWLCTVAGKEDKQAQARAMAADLVVALQTTMNQQVDLLVEQLGRSLRRMLSIAQDAAAILNKQAHATADLTSEAMEAAADPELDKVYRVLQDAVASGHARLLASSKKAVEEMVFGCAVLPVPEDATEGEAASSDEEVKAGEWEKRLPKKVQERMAAKRQAAEAGWVQEVWDSATGQFRLHSEWKRLFAEAKKEKKGKNSTGVEEGTGTEGGGEAGAGDGEEASAAVVELTPEEEEEVWKAEEEAVRKAEEKKQKRMAKLKKLLQKADLPSKAADKSVAVAGRACCHLMSKADAKLASPSTAPATKAPAAPAPALAAASVAGAGGEQLHLAMRGAVNSLACLAYCASLELDADASFIAKNKARACRSAALDRLASALVGAVQHVDEAAPPSGEQEEKLEERCGRVATKLTETMLQEVRGNALSVLPSSGQDQAQEQTQQAGGAVQQALEGVCTKGMTAGMKRAQPILQKMTATAWGAKEAVKAQGSSMADSPLGRAREEVCAKLGEQVDAMRAGMEREVGGSTKEAVGGLVAKVTAEEGQGEAPVKSAG